MNIKNHYLGIFFTMSKNIDQCKNLSIDFKFTCGSNDNLVLTTA